MKGQTSIILAFIFALIVAIFAVINVDPVMVNYLFGTGEAPLIIVILSSVLMGGLMVAAFGMVKFFKLQRENRSLKKALKALEEQQVNDKALDTPTVNNEEEQAPIEDEADEQDSINEEDKK